MMRSTLSDLMASNSAYVEGVAATNAASTGAGAKKRSREPESPSETLLSSVTKHLTEVQAQWRRHTTRIEEVEVEVRIGMILSEDKYKRWQPKTHSKAVICVDGDGPDRARAGVSFKAGIDRIFAVQLQEKLSQTPFQATALPTQTVRCDDRGNRWNVNPSTGAVEFSEQKRHFVRIDMALLSHDYDIRFNGAIESPASQSNVLNPQVWQQQRVKRRTCYQAPAAYPSWKIDFTDVDVTSKPSGIGDSSISRGPLSVGKEIEIEFELNDSAKAEWLGATDENEANRALHGIAHQLVQLIKVCVPPELAASQEESLKSINITSAPAKVLSIQKSISESNEMIQGGTSNNNRTGKIDFLGSMPVNMSRQNLANSVCSLDKDYFITEKSDGVRYLMYVVNAVDGSGAGARGGGGVGGASTTPIAVLFNRSKEIFEFRGSVALGAALGWGTVLDGELVYNETHKVHLFLVFDVLLWKCKSWVAHPFRDRLNLVRTEVIPSSAKAFQQTTASTPQEVPLALVRKDFVEKGRLQSLLDKIKPSPVDGKRVFQDGDRRHHKTDGIIFQPDAPYVFSRSYDLLKWKWSELRSVDLLVTTQQQQPQPQPGSSDSSLEIHLSCSGPDGTLINCTKRGHVNVGLGQFDSYRLLADLEANRAEVMRTGGQRAAAAYNPIAEVSYDASVGLWTYLHLRRDKVQPNFIDSVIGVFMEQAEAISVEELEYALNAATKGTENDFDRRMSKMKKTLIEWQRQQPASSSGTVSGGNRTGSGAGAN